MQGPYLGFRDLLKRWVYTRQGLYKLLGTEDFPSPAFTINAGRTKVWELGPVEAFEKKHPEVLSEEAKRRKTDGFFRAICRGNRPPK